MTFPPYYVTPIWRYKEYKFDVLDKFRSRDAAHAMCYALT